jgi:Cap4 dsDNA endonuclease
MTKVSYRDLSPAELGGEFARQGFDFQDHVAVHYYLEMLHNSKIVEVWCENLDDITIIYSEDGNEIFEFVQVKSNDTGNLWSTAMFCERKKNAKGIMIGTSIAEKLLANDRAEGVARFRMATLGNVNGNLHPLTLADKAAKNINIESRKDFEKRIGGFKSKNENNYEFLVDNLSWTVFHGTEQVKLKNMYRLREYLEKNGFIFFSDQIEEIYAKLVGLAYNAAKSSYSNNPLDKRMSKDHFIESILSISQKTQNPQKIDGVTPVGQKLIDAGLKDYLSDADEQRIYYLRKRRDDRFLQTVDNIQLEAEAVSVLNDCKLKLDLGEFDSPIEFLVYCKRQLQKLDVRIPETITGINPYLEGYMFHRANRCVFRFKRAE